MFTKKRINYYGLYVVVIEAKAYLNELSTWVDLSSLVEIRADSI